MRRNAFEPAQKLRSLSHFVPYAYVAETRNLARANGRLRGQRAIGRKTEVRGNCGRPAQGMAAQGRLVYSGWAPYFMRNCGSLVPPHLAGPAELPTDPKKGTWMPKIALVDDDRNILTSVSLTLEAEGYNVSTYTDGASGLEGLTSDRPDLAILDIKMPRMDGMELLRRLRQKSDLPVIFLTSQGRGDRRVVRPQDGRRRFHQEAVQPAPAGRAGQIDPAPLGAARRHRAGRRPSRSRARR